MATETKTVHVWMLDGRSLCDRRAYPAPRPDQTDEDHRVAQEVSKAAPACAPCLLLANRIRREAAVILRRHSKVHPARPSAAWESLRATRWESYLDLDAIRASAENIDKYTDYTMLVAPMSVALIEELSSEFDEMVAAGVGEDRLGGKRTNAL